MTTAVFGIAIFLWTLISDRQQTDLARIVNAITTALGAFLTLVGLTLIILWAWRYIVRKFVKQQPDPANGLSLPTSTSRK
jgi:hypothetical protein